jgi:hypothetical protein
LCRFLGILGEVDHGEIAELLLQYRTGIQNFFFWKINEDVVGVVGRTQLNARMLPLSNSNSF